MNDQEVPIKFRCPICGKWGRTHWAENGIRYYYCNPKARRGGKGCGEYFRRLEPACEAIKSSLIELTLYGKSFSDRMVEMGFKMIEALKEKGYHDPNARSFPSSRIHTLFTSDTHCDCGCGRATMNIRFASKSCGEVTYNTAHMIGNQGKHLYDFLTELRGRECEKCGDKIGPFDIDHIIEVKEGGGMCWVDNFQILCRNKCHKEKTAKYAAFRAERNRGLKPKQEDLQLNLF